MEKIECLKSALTAIETCQKSGMVTQEAFGPLGAAVALQIVPPFVLRGRKPLVVDGVRTPAGSWPHFLKAICTAEAQQWDLKALQIAAKAGDERAQKRANFLNYILTAIHGALLLAQNKMESTKRREQSQAEREAEEAQRRERDERRAARNALLLAGRLNTEKPEIESRMGDTVKGSDGKRHPRLTVERVKSLLGSQTQLREQDGLVGSEAKLAATRFLVRLVLEAADNASYTDNEVSLLKSEVKAFVTSVYFAESHDLQGAEREAQAYLDRAVAFENRRRAPRPASKSNPAPSKPAASTPAPKSEPAPAAKPAAAGNGGGIMAQAMSKAGLAANG